RNGCTGVRAVVYASGEVRAEAVAIEGAVLTLAEAPPEGRTVETVALNLPDIGFELEVRVVAQEGNQLTLQRAPPSAPELGTVRLSLDRTPVQVRIVEERGDLMVLDAPLPEGLEAESIARYNGFGLVGLRNFRATGAQASLALFPVVGWNVAFASLTVIINLAAGVFLAVLLNNQARRFRNGYRTLLIVPWALPSVITIQVWKGFLNQNF